MARRSFADTLRDVRGGEVMAATTMHPVTSSNVAAIGYDAAT